MKLILASRSERRQRLLREAGIEFDLACPDVEEIVMEDNAFESVHRNALNKHTWTAAQFPGRPILTADTAIEFNGHCIGKPASAQEAVEMLKAFSGKTHTVLTAVAFSRGGQPPVVRIGESKVTFRELTDSDIGNYLSLFDPTDRAGAYDIAEHGKLIVASYSGSFTNIVGLPMEIVLPLLKGL